MSVGLLRCYPSQQLGVSRMLVAAIYYGVGSLGRLPGEILYGGIRESLVSG